MKARFCRYALVAALMVLVVMPAVIFAVEDDGLPVSVDWELFTVEHPPEGEAPLVLVVWLTPDEGYYAYGHEPGPTGQPTVLSLTPPPNVTAEIFYPTGKFKPDAFDPSLEVEVFESRTPIFVALHGEPGPALLMAGELGMLLCSDTSCWPVRHELAVEELELAPGALATAEKQSWWPRYLALSAGEPDPANLLDAGDMIEVPQPEEGEAQQGEDATGVAAIEGMAIRPQYFQPALEVQGMGKAALLAILAGLILNFMPCVLPVVSLKLSTLVSATGVGEAGAKTRRFREHNIFFALGILIYFAVLGVVLGMAGLAWGQLFQEAWLIMVVTGVVFGLGLSLFGVFDLPIVDLKSTREGAHSNRTQALFTGLLATLLATPCSGPFLGGVLGWTLTQAPSTIVVVFLCIGLGMALPYLLMAFKPGLVRLFPKPGGWTVFLERLVGFFLMGTCVYLLIILPSSFMPSALTLLLAVAFAAWMWGAWTSLSDPTGKRLGIRAAALAVVVAVGIWAVQPPDTGAAWTIFDAEGFAELHSKRNLLIDFTADWCPNCKVLEKTTLAPDNLEEWQQEYDLELLQADLSEDNPAAQALLRKLGSQSIPVVALFPAGEGADAPLVLRDLVTTGQLERALAQTFGSPVKPDGEN